VAPDGRQTSAGQTPDDPVQASATSHTPAALRQSAVAGANESAGQAADAPVQASATSHTPVGARQT
jgi:hypothetical protein